jgi:hypothetical protein
VSELSQIVESWIGVISKKAQVELFEEAKTDGRLSHFLEKHCN